jgi:hypothetical protein
MMTDNLNKPIKTTAYQVVEISTLQKQGLVQGKTKPKSDSVFTYLLTP